MGGVSKHEVVGDRPVGGRVIMTGIPVWQLGSFC